MSRTDCLVVVGPTASGKSSFLYNNFQDYPLYIISADSMQVYSGFDIATATPSAAELAMFPHAGINCLSPTENYNVADFLELCQQAFRDAGAAGCFPVVVGGTALYIKTFLFGLDEMPAADSEYRARLREQARKAAPDFLHEKLKKIDPAAAQKIHPNDWRRIIRALEIFHLSGKTKSELISENDKIRPGINPLVIGLNRPPKELKKRIRLRVEKMFDQGLAGEIESLREEYSLARNLRQAIGFPEVEKYLAGKIDKETLVAEMTASTWQFARKQMTWFKRLPVEKWYHPEEEKKELKKRIEQKISET
ncbi:MAG: tRNA (adenosine(37)-N6)-dimethylallyltransferase MiaA [bacterium]